MATDKKTIGITKANASTLTALVAAGRFGSELDAAKFALAFAVQSSVPSGATDGAETKWNVGSVDPDGSLRSLVEALYPNVSDPYRVMEHLINEGIKALSERTTGPGSLYDTLFVRAPTR